MTTTEETTSARKRAVTQTRVCCRPAPYRRRRSQTPGTALFGLLGAVATCRTAVRISCGPLVFQARGKEGRYCSTVKVPVSQTARLLVPTVLTLLSLAALACGETSGGGRTLPHPTLAAAVRYEVCLAVLICRAAGTPEGGDFLRLLAATSGQEGASLLLDVISHSGANERLPVRKLLLQKKTVQDHVWRCWPTLWKLKQMVQVRQLVKSFVRHRGWNVRKRSLQVLQQ